MTMAKFDHRSMLLTVSNQLGQSELKALIFYFKDIIPVSEAEYVSVGTDLFSLLEFKSKLGPENYEDLRQALLSTGRHDLAQLLPNKFDEHFSKLVVDETSLFKSRRCPQVCCTQAGFSYNMLLTQISLELRSKDIRELANICTSEAGLSPKSVASGTELFALMEEKKLLGACNIEFLSERLKVIGRDDLSRKLLSLKLFQYLPRTLDGNQHLFLKTRLLSLKQDHFASECTWLSVVLKGDWAQHSRFTTPLLKSLYTFNSQHDASSGVSTLVSQLQKILKNKAEPMQMLETAIVNIFDYLELYAEGHLYVHDNAPHTLDSIKKITAFLDKASEHISLFEEAVESTNWNPEIQQRIHKEREDRVTPIGTPAHNACMLIYELCKETFGGKKIDEDIRQIDEMIFRLESGYYLLCYRFLTFQWLFTLVGITNTFSAIDKTKLQQILTDIIQNRLHHITGVYPLLMEILGEETLQKLHKFVPELAGAVQANQTVSNNNLLRSLYLPFYAFLLELLAVLVLGEEALDPDEFSRRMRLHQNRLSGTESYQKSCVQVTKNFMIAYLRLIEEFRNAAVSSNLLCAPLVLEFAQTDTFFTSYH